MEIFFGIGNNFIYFNDGSYDKPNEWDIRSENKFKIGMSKMFIKRKGIELLFKNNMVVKTKTPYIVRGCYNGWYNNGYPIFKPLSLKEIQE